MSTRRKSIQRNLYTAAAVLGFVAAVIAKWSMWIAISMLVGSVICLTSTLYVSYTREIFPDETIQSMLNKLKVSDDDVEIQESGLDAIHVRLLLKFRRSSPTATDSDDVDVVDQYDDTTLLQQVLNAITTFPDSIALAKHAHAVLSILFTSSKQYRPKNSDIPRRLFSDLVSSVRRHIRSGDFKCISKGIMAIGGIANSPFEDDAYPNDTDITNAATVVRDVWQHHQDSVDVDVATTKDVVTWCLWAAVHMCFHELNDEASLRRNHPACEVFQSEEVMKLVEKCLFEHKNKNAVQLCVSLCSILIRVEPSVIMRMCTNEFVALLQATAKEQDQQPEIKMHANALLQAVNKVRRK